MEITNLAELENSLLFIRTEFNQSIKSIKYIIEKPINLLFNWIKIIKSVATNTDDERYVLEVLVTAFRRVISSYILLESGFIRESLIPIRNYQELMLIAIDITYNQESLLEWKRSDQDELITNSRENWYFKKAKICKRIEEDNDNVYPLYARHLARSLCHEWNIVSNLAGHEHASSQIRQLLKRPGHFSILERAAVKTCKGIFEEYRLLLLKIISVLIEIPKYRGKISNSSSILQEANRLAQEYDKLTKEALSET